MILMPICLQASPGSSNSKQFENLIPHKAGEYVQLSEDPDKNLSTLLYIGKIRRDHPGACSFSGKV